MFWVFLGWMSCVALVHAEIPADNIPRGLKCLKAAYPEHVCEIRPNTLVWCDGTVMLYDDGVKKKSFADKLANPDLEDQMSQAYSREDESSWRPSPGADPGRIRYQPFFQKLYGKDRSAVEKNVGTVHWMPNRTKRRLRVTRVNGVGDKLKAISNALATLPPATQTLAKKTAGGFYWRRIRGTNRLSMHSFGIAVDVAMSRADYWRWRGVRRYRNRVPIALVRLFESHGFIWGGRWYHYDTMHFEYRPELLVADCLKTP